MKKPLSVLAEYRICRIETNVYFKSKIIPRITPSMPVILSTIGNYAETLIGILQHDYPTARIWEISLTWTNPDGTSSHLRKATMQGEETSLTPWETNMEISH